MQLMIELHGLWNLKTADDDLPRRSSRSSRSGSRIRSGPTPSRPSPVSSRRRRCPLAMGETVVGRRGFLPLLQQRAVDVITADVQWTGGLTEARKIASLADAFGVPVAPHDCTGPVTFAACAHLVMSQPNGLVQETVRAFLRTWYADLVDGLPVIGDGRLRLSREPGLGVLGLKDDLPVSRISVPSCCRIVSTDSQPKKAEAPTSTAIRQRVGAIGAGSVVELSTTSRMRIDAHHHAAGAGRDRPAAPAAGARRRATIDGAGADQRPDDQAVDAALGERAVAQVGAT